MKITVKKDDVEIIYDDRPTSNDYKYPALINHENYKKAVFEYLEVAVKKVIELSTFNK